MDIVQVTKLGHAAGSAGPRRQSQHVLSSRAWHPVQVIAYSEALPPVTIRWQHGKSSCLRESTISISLPDQSVQLRTQLEELRNQLTWHSVNALHAVHPKKGGLPTHCNWAQSPLDPGSLLKPKAHG